MCCGLLLFFAWLEETEVYAAVDALLHEAGVVGKAVVLAVLEDEHAFGGEHTFVYYEVGQLGQSGERVGRVGEDDVEGVVTLLDVAEHVGS